ncbi:MAG TPA: hypothetical protein VHD85_21820 [Terracidiphilus sp.]|nr:hypothetical protein [Terracidiphilus sp.]
MATFNSQRSAKEYLIGRIVAEAGREGKPLSEIERKMLYFSETGWTLPDIMEVNAEFERDYDNDEYERKICSLGQAIESQLENASAEESDKWYEAIQKLSEGDHYLLVLLNPRLVSGAAPERPPGDLFKLSLTALGIVAGSLGLMIVGNWLFDQKFWHVLDSFFGHH